MNGETTGKRTRLLLRACLGASAAAVIVSSIMPRAARSDTGLAGIAGVDTALPSTESALTISGTGTFDSLKVTVNQTKHLLNQAVSVTWKGGIPTDAGSGSSGATVAFKSNFLQIFQCWGDDGTHTGPPPSQCEYGGVESVPNRFPPGVASGAATSRQLDHGIASADYQPSEGFLDGGTLYSPYQSVDGTVVNKMFNPYTGPQFIDAPGRVWANPFFDYYTSNEIDFGRTYGDGTGAELFQVYTGQQARGLGCGQKVLKQSDGSFVIPKCWLVIVPRSTGAVENSSDHDPSVRGLGPVSTSPLAQAAWKNRLVVPLDFNPADSPCSIGALERRIVGNELATAAITSWQPTLCQTAGLPPYAYGSVSDDQARQILLSGESGAAGMAVVSTALDPTVVKASNPVVYAPLTLSGLVIGFNVERSGSDKNGNIVDPGEIPLNGVRVEHLNLTPRLVAKLLTESYRQQFLDIVATKPKGYDWISHNPDDLFDDPDFVQYNPEFRALTSGNRKNTGGLVVEQTTSDAAQQVWKWVLADPEASAWMAGRPDMTGCPAGATQATCGTRVNPVFSTDAATNPVGVAFADPTPPNGFPKSDQYCFHPPPQPDPNKPSSTIVPRPLCMQDVLPYSLSLEQAAQETRAANDQAKTTHVPVAGQTAETWWTSDGPQIQGVRAIMAVTDTAAAVRYGLQTASLSRAGDDTTGRRFLAPDTAGLTAGAQAMIPSSVSEVLQPNPATTVAGAYPLTSLSYAVATPRSLDSGARSDYAAFVNYAAGAGQVVGLALGQLPPGYAPLPAALRERARAVASMIKSGLPAPASASTTTVPARSRPLTSGASSGKSAAPSVASGQLSPASVTPAPPLASPAENGLPLQIVHTVAIAVGSMRYTLPIALSVAVIAGAMGVFLTRRKGKSRPSSPPSAP